MMYRIQKLKLSCQLVAAVNARIYLGAGDVTDEEYERLIDLACCRNECAINMEEVERELGLGIVWSHLNAFTLAEPDRLPLAFNIENVLGHKGRHVIVMVGIDPVEGTPGNPVCEIVGLMDYAEVTKLRFVDIANPFWDMADQAKICKQYVLRE